MKILIETAFEGDEKYDLPVITPELTVEQLDILKAQIGYRLTATLENQALQELIENKRYYHQRTKMYFRAFKSDEGFWRFTHIDKNGKEKGTVYKAHDMTMRYLRLVAGQK
jgi:hypothetical protein